jgi:hypothetical protein
MAYSGKFRPTNISKYEGDHTAVKYRSLWERQCMSWLDKNPDVIAWSSEEVVIPYRCKTDNKMHRYFMDLKVRLSNGKTYLIEIKPAKETIEPKIKTKKTRAYLNEVMKYMKNTSKWETAKVYANDRGWEFQIWTEHTIKALGIKLLT